MMVRPPSTAEMKSRADRDRKHALKLLREAEKQQLKDQQAAAAAQLGSSQAQAPPQLAAAPGSPSGASAPPRRAHFGALVHSFAAG